jgi:fatty-acyl-CoA synthase
MDLGIEIHAGYGMSETCPVMTNATPNEPMLGWTGEAYLNVITKTGKPLPLTHVEVVDTNDAVLPHDGSSTGEVVMRSPWLTQSYFKDPERTKDLWRNGWLHSGDVGFIDAYGYLQITDRMKDVIKTGGEWVSSLDLENMLSRHEAVLESAAIGIPDPKWGERPLMIVTLKPEYQGKVTAEDLKAYMLESVKQGNLPAYGVPDRYEFAEALPKTSVGKLDKKVLRKQYT